MNSLEFNFSYILRLFKVILGIQRYFYVEVSAQLVALFLRIPEGPGQILDRGSVILSGIFHGFSSVPNDKCRAVSVTGVLKIFLCHGSL
jgi:hypothetical protein